MWLRMAAFLITLLVLAPMASASGRRRRGYATEDRTYTDCQSSMLGGSFSCTSRTVPGQQSFLQQYLAQQMAQPQVVYVPTPPAPTPAAPQGLTPAQILWIVDHSTTCPVCTEVYPAEYRLCPRDGAALRPTRAMAEELGYLPKTAASPTTLADQTATPATKFCPVGGETFPSTVNYCPTHGMELRIPQR